MRILLMCFVATGVAFITPLRVSISLHAISSSFIQIIAESVKDQTKTIYLHDANLPFVEIYGASLVVLFIGVSRYSLPTSPLKKLYTIPDFVKLEHFLKNLFLIFVTIFFQNVDNAL